MFYPFESVRSDMFYPKIIQYEYHLQVKNVMKTDYNYEWLPSRSLDWYKEYINKHDKDTQVSKRY